MAVYCTKGILRSTRAVHAFWPGVKPLSNSLLLGLDPESDRILCWGSKPSAKRAALLADRFGVPLVRLEDGFIRSAGLGVDGDRALSLYVDPVGIYYDATRTSLLETVLLSGTGLAELHPQAIEAMELIVAHGISKYNQCSPQNEPLVPAGEGAVLVVDQTVGDQSVEKGLAGADAFYQMLNAAKKENPGKTVIVKRHPDVVAGKKQGYLDDIAVTGDMVVVSEGNPYDLFLSVDKVYVVTSQLGFEALMAGKSVVCFGAPFYAGWGGTDDRLPIPRRGKVRTVADIFAAAYLVCCRYVDPVTWGEGDIFKVIHHVLLQREKRRQNKERSTACVGMSWWKHKIVAPFFKGGETPPANLAAKDVGSGPIDRLALWGYGYRDLVASNMVTSSQLLFMEDGFLRSVGLGSNLVPPLSLVIDRCGLYYDATCPSAMEAILSSHLFPDDLIERARRLRQVLVDQRITKYNLGGHKPDLSQWSKPDRRMLLVVGQVPGDASLRFGANGGPVNDHQLMMAVRAAHPEDFIVYKPHPDVISSNRPGKTESTAASALADLTVDEADTLSLVEQCDEVHTMTSLTGFEALLRDNKVVCYGMPFYAGWGLTEDRTFLGDGRRQRRLTLDQLAAGAMILYPEYIHPVTGDFITVEDAVRILILQREASRALPGVARLGFWGKKLNKLKHLLGQTDSAVWPEWMGAQRSCE